jgi:vacuolar-type H+-ATPase subunit E/Vma4
MGGVYGDVETLKGKVIQQAQEQAAEILDRAKRASERDLVYARQEADEIKAQYREKVSPMAAVEGRKTLVNAEMEARKKLMQKKEELVSRIFAEAEEKMKEMRGSGEYVDMIYKLIEHGLSSIGDDAVVEFSEKDRGIFTPETISSIESHIKKSLDKDVKLDFQSIGDNISAGVMVKSNNGRIVVNNSFSNLLGRLKDEIRGEVSEMLLQE